MSIKKTHLEIVQIIMSKLDSDEINSIGDTTESLQVSQEVETTFYEILSNFQVPERQKLIAFEGLADPDNRPTYLKVNELVDNFEFVMYNIGTADAPSLKKIIYLEPKDFLLRAAAITDSSSVAVTTDPSGAKFYIKNDAPPTYYTTFDDEYLVFDSYDSSVEDTLQESKAYGWAQVIPEYEQTDDYVPELPAKLFPLLIAEAASMCFINHKQAPNSKEEQRARRQLVRNLNNKRRSVEAQLKGPDYGRNR